MPSGSDGLTVWDLRSRSVSARLQGAGAQIRAVAVLGDGRVAGGTAQGTVCIWGLADEEVLLTTRPRALDNWVRGLAAYRGTDRSVRLASVGHGTTVRVWDVASPDPIAELEGHEDWVTSVATFAEERPYLVTGGDADDCTVRVWDGASYTPVCVLYGHSDAVRSVTTYRNVAGVWRIASGGRDCTVRIWDPHAAAPLHTITLGTRVNAVRAPAGGGLVVGTAEGHLVIELPADL